ncbi:MAG TPA: DUF1918 domain-containing protein [Streptosporangiaceae bacterium]|nr:DUF1918 domain-containing protein [Streptosporangiaceae bacterium]
MRANVGDELIVEKAGSGASGRVGTIVGVRTSDGSPPYLVHWVVGDYDALVFPWPGVRIRPRTASRNRRGAMLAGSAG